jgi:hypothetical protein
MIKLFSTKTATIMAKGMLGGTLLSLVFYFTQGERVLWHLAEHYGYRTETAPWIVGGAGAIAGLVVGSLCAVVSALFCSKGST